VKRRIKTIKTQPCSQDFSLEDGRGGERPLFLAPPTFKGKALGTRLIETN